MCTHTACRPNSQTVGHILLEYYADSAPFVFASFHIVVFFFMVVAQVTLRSNLSRNDYAVIKTCDVAEGAYPAVDRGRNGAPKIPAPNISQELLLWK